MTQKELMEKLGVTREEIKEASEKLNLNLKYISKKEEELITNFIQEQKGVKVSPDVIANKVVSELEKYFDSKKMTVEELAYLISQNRSYSPESDWELAEKIVNKI